MKEIERRWFVSILVGTVEGKRHCYVSSLYYRLPDIFIIMRMDGLDARGAFDPHGYRRHLVVIDSRFR